MTRRIVLSLFSVLLNCSLFASISIEESIDELYDMLQPQQWTKMEFFSGMTNGMNLWRMSKDFGVGNAEGDMLCRWYSSFVTADVSPMADNEGTNRWLFVKSELVERISHNPTIQNSTNCMMALAVELGRIRSGLMTSDDWYNLRGIGHENREVRPDGVVLVRVSDFADYEQQRRDAMVRRLQAIQSLRERIARNIVWGFEGFLESTTFLALPTDVRAEFVSNIVSVARFTHQEVCDLNLTNGVVNCQKEDE